jgi:hypothetical protein
MNEKERMFTEEEAKKAAEAMPDFIGERVAQSMMDLVMTSMKLAARMASMPDSELTDVEREFMKASASARLNLLMVTTFSQGFKGGK